jgi:hypothetical protein
MNAEVIEKVVNEIAEFNQFEANLVEFKKQYEGVVYDLNDPAQDKQARSDRLSVGKVIILLDKTHKELKAPLKAKTDLIDHERKRIKDDLLSVQLLIKSQIEKHEQEIADHAEMLQGRVEAIELCFTLIADSNPTSKEIKESIETVNSFKVDGSYEHRKADALLAKTESLEKLELMLEAQLKVESEQAELQRLRDEEAARLQAERDEAIRKEAAEKATHDAELAAQKKIDDAENDKLQAIEETKRAEEQAERQAEQARKQERERIEAEQAEAKRKQDEADKKEAAKKEKQAYRAKVHKAAKADFIKAGFCESDATNLVNIIKDGKIKNIIIEY